MARRKYELKDVQDYLLYHYGAEWKDLKVYDHFEERDIQDSDFEEDFLNVTAVLIKDKEKHYCWLTVDNNCLRVHGITTLNRRKWWTWSQYVANKENAQTI